MNPAKNEKSRYQVPNLERALKIMEYLADRQENATMAQIARELDYPNNSVFRIVSTLEAEGYVVKKEDSKEFMLSRKMLSLGYKALVETSLVEQAVDILRDLRDETRETALLGILLEGEGVVLEQELSPEPIKFTVSPGTLFALHTAAPAKAILAYLDERERKRQIAMINFQCYTSRTICTPNKFEEELQQVKCDGYGVDREEQANGVICIGAPVFDYRDYPKAAVWVTGPEYRIPAEKISTIGEIVKKHAKALSVRMGSLN